MPTPVDRLLALTDAQIEQDATVVCLDWNGGRTRTSREGWTATGTPPAPPVAQHAAVARTRSVDEARRKQKRADN